MSARVITTITAEDIDRHREVLCSWAVANGLEPQNVAAGPGLTVERVGRRTVIVYREYQRDARGWLLVDPDAPDQVLTVRRSVTQVETLTQHGYSEPDQLTKR